MNDRKEKKKLLIAVHSLSVGGVQKSLLSALNALDYDSFDVTLYVRQDRCALLPQIDPRVKRIVVNKDPTRYYRQPRAVALHLLSRAAKLCGRSGDRYEERLRQYVVDAGMRYEKSHYFADGQRYDLAASYIQGYTAQFTAQYVNAAKKIMFFHGSTDEHNALHNKIMGAFDRIVAVSESCRTMLQTTYPAFAGKICYIENHVDAKAVREKAGAVPPELPKDRPVLCTCGRFTKVKGFDLAVRAAGLLKARDAVFVWDFVGDGPERETLAASVAENGLSGVVRMTGMLENPYPYIAGCDIYVQPSYEEAHPLAILEAQILCRPVVSTATAGGKATIRDGETGALAAITAEALADRIDAMLRDRALRERIGENLGKLDWAADEKRFRAEWETLLEEG